MNQSLLSFFLNADPVVKGVMLLLLGASLWSWTIIFQRSVVFSRVRKLLRQFEEKFWAGADLSTLYQSINDMKRQPAGFESIFQAGFKEFVRLKKHQLEPAEVMAGSERAMRVALTGEINRLEQSLQTLATIGSTSPYIGLLGTVWGIMTSFQALGSVQQASIAMVAPGISEALIATAMGLFAAIPAVIAYNRYTASANVLISQFDSFQDELTNILHREAHTANHETAARKVPAAAMV